MLMKQELWEQRTPARAASPLPDAVAVMPHAATKLHGAFAHYSDHLTLHFQLFAPAPGPPT